MTPLQRRIAFAALTFASIVAIALLSAYCVQIIGRLLGFFSPVLWPIAVAAISALILKPGIDFCRHRLGLSPFKSVLLLYVLFALGTLAVIAYVLPTLVSEGANLARSIPGLFHSLFAWLQKKSYVTDENAQKVYDLFLGNAEKASALAFSTVQKLVGQTLGLVTATVGLFLVPVYLYFFLRSSADWGRAIERFRETISFLKPGARDDLVCLTREFAHIVVAFYRGQVLICLLTGVLYALGFLIVGLNFGLVIGLAWGVLNIVPYLGTIVGLAVAIPMAFFQDEGGLFRFGSVAIVIFIVQALDGAFFTPKIMGRQTGLHPVVIILSILFWGRALDGILGMLVGIPLTACIVTLWRWAGKKAL